MKIFINNNRGERKRAKSLNQIYDKIIQLRRTGLPFSKISDKLNIHIKVVTETCKRNEDKLESKILTNKPYRIKNRILQRTYGINMDDYIKMSENQLNCCAICKKFRDETDEFLHIDHDHQTGKVRGLLCRNCNQALGFFKDDINILCSAIKYLKGFYV